MSHPQIANEIKPFLTRDLVFLTPGRAFGARYFTQRGESRVLSQFLRQKQNCMHVELPSGVSISGIKALVKSVGEAGRGQSIYASYST